MKINNNRLDVRIGCKKMKEMSEYEKKETNESLYRVFEILMKIDQEDKKRQEKLEKYPKGFHMEGGPYGCCICSSYVSDDNTWYDRWGIKCLICQEAIDSKVVPGFIAKEGSSWYSRKELDDYFNLTTKDVNKLIEDGVLNPIAILNEKGRAHCNIFAIRDHKGILPPKKLVKDRYVPVDDENNEMMWVSSEPWYKFEDIREDVSNYEIYNFVRLL